MLRLAVALGLGAISLMSAPVKAEVTELGEASFVVRHSVVVAKPPRDVWLALISPAKWWNKSHTWSGDAANLSITPQAGGCFCERIPGEDNSRSVGLEGSAQHMVVVHAFPDKVLRMRGGLGPLQSEPAQGVLTITLQKVGQGTRINMEYIVGGAMRYKTPELAKAVDAVIGVQMEGLATLLGLVEMPAAKPEPKPSEGKAGDAAPAGEDTAGKSVSPAAKTSVNDAFDDIGKDAGAAPAAGEGGESPEGA